MKTVTLHCELGDHEWERPSQRGRRPASCPECLAKNGAEKPKSQESAKARPRDALLTSCEELVGSLKSTDERDKALYCMEQIERRGRSDDVSHLVDTLEKIFKPLGLNV